MSEDRLPLDSEGRESTSSSSVGGDMSERTYESEVDMAADDVGVESDALLSQEMIGVVSGQEKGRRIGQEEHLMELSPASASTSNKVKHAL